MTALHCSLRSFTDLQSLEEFGTDNLVVRQLVDEELGNVHHHGRGPG